MTATVVVRIADRSLQWRSQSHNMFSVWFTIKNTNNIYDRTVRGWNWWSVPCSEGNRGDGMEMYCTDGFGQQKKKKF